MTQRGMEDGETSLEELLGNDVEEESMAELEKTYERMQQMQKEGADIYFGGFSQMKRFSFFYTLCNWFMPFYMEHPQIQQAVAEWKDSRFLQKMLQHGPFCDSDKYSLVLAMSSLMGQMPAEMREMVENNAEMEYADRAETMGSASQVRVAYLQDLYRFFKLYTRTADFISPFDYTDDSCSRFFMANSGLSTTSMLPLRISLAQFLIYRSEYPYAEHMLRRIDDQMKEGIQENDYKVSSSKLQEQNGPTSKVMLLWGMLKIRQHDYEEAMRYYQRLLVTMPDEERLWKGMAHAAYHARHYNLSAQYYKRLADTYPDHPVYRSNLAVSLLEEDRVEEAMPLVFRLHYEKPADIKVTRMLAWGQLLQGKSEESVVSWRQILSSDETILSDYLHLGFALWADGNMKDACDAFRDFMSHSKTENDLYEDFLQHEKVLSLYGISKTDMLIMVDIATDTSLEKEEPV